MNTVVSGDYKDRTVECALGSKDVYISLGLTKSLPLNKTTVMRYEVMDKEARNGFSAGKAAVGTAVFGYGGAVAGIKSNQVYRVAVYFRDGKKSLLEVDSKIYGYLAAELFGVEDYRVVEPAPQEKDKPPILAKVLIFCVSVVVCVLIASLFSPVVDGVIQLNTFGTIFVFGVPILLTVIFPRKKK